MIKDEIRKQLLPLVKNYVKDIIEQTSTEAEKYGEDLAEDFLENLWAAYMQGDTEAETNIQHLKVQVKQRAMINRLRLTSRTQRLIEQGLSTILQILLKTLVNVK